MHKICTRAPICTKCTPMHQNAIKCTPLCILKCTKCAPVYLNAQNVYSMHKNTQICICAPKCTKFAPVHQHAPESAHLCTKCTVCTKMCTKCAPVHHYAPNAHSCTKIASNAHSVHQNAQNVHPCTCTLTNNVHSCTLNAVCLNRLTLQVHRNLLRNLGCDGEVAVYSWYSHVIEWRLM